MMSVEGEDWHKNWTGGSNSEAFEALEGELQQVLAVGRQAQTETM